MYDWDGVGVTNNVVDTNRSSLVDQSDDLNNNNNYDNLYGAVTRPYRYKGALQATTLGRP